MTFIIGFLVSMFVSMLVEWRYSERFHHSILTFCWFAASLFGFVESLIFYMIERLIS